MTTDEINIAIAELNGWTDIREYDYYNHRGEVLQYWGGEHPEEELNKIPDYSNDLNLMFTVIEKLSDDEYESYRVHLSNVILHSKLCDKKLTDRFIVESIAYQKAIAYLKMKRLYQ